MASLVKEKDGVRTQTWSGREDLCRDGEKGFRTQLLASIMPLADPYKGLGYSRSHTALDQPVPKNNPLVRTSARRGGKAAPGGHVSRGE